MLIAGQLLLDDQQNRCRIEPGYLRVEDDRIVEVVTGEIPDRAEIGGSDVLVTPGFIDAHVHLPQFDMIGAHGLPLLRWLNEVTFVEEMRWSDTDYARAMSRRVLGQLLTFGTTGICAYATVHHASAKAALEIASGLGIRGVIGQVLMDRGGPPELCEPPTKLMEEVTKLTEEFPPGGRVAAAVTPRFAVSCTGELLEASGRLAREVGAMIQTHLAETQRECRLVSELFDGVGYVDVYRNAGLLQPSAVFGHGIHLSSSDRSALRQANASIAHCPTANSFLRSGTMNRSQLVRDSVGVALGSDIGAGYERSMVRVGRAMIEAASAITDDYPDAATAWHAITAGNADRLGWSDAGRLGVGQAADIVVCRPDVRWLQSPTDPLSFLMFAWDDRWIKQVLLRGQVAFQA